MSEEKSLKKNSFFNVMYKLLNVFFPLIYTAYLSRVLLPIGVGKVGSAQNIVQYFTMLAALGIPTYGIREIAKVRDHFKDRDKVFSELFFINAASTTIFLLAYYLFINFHPFFTDNRLLYNICGINVLFNYINVDWFYQGEEEYKYIAIRSFVIKVLSTISMFIFIRNETDYVLYAFIYFLSLGANNILNIVNLRKYNIHLSIRDLSVKRHIRPIVILLGTAIAIELYTMLDTTMLTIICDDQVVAYYTNTIKLVRVLITLVTAIGGVLLPRLSYYSANDDLQKRKEVVEKIFYIMFYLFMPIGVGVYLVSDLIVLTIFGNAFSPCILTLKIASLLIYALGFSNLFGTQILLSYGCEKKLFYATLFGAVSNITMNLFMIPHFQQNGAIIASVISELLVTMITFYFSSKFVKISFNRKLILKTSISTLVMAVTVILVRHSGLENSGLGNIVYLLVNMAVGVIVYFATSILMRNEVICELIGGLTRKH